MKSLLLTTMLLLVAAPAGADQITTVTIPAEHVRAELRTLAEQRDEPVGLVAIAKHPKLGLAKGDVVRRINGAPASRFAFMGGQSNVLYLDVLRGNKPISIRVVLKFDRRVEAEIDRELFQMIAERTKRHGLGMTQITKNGEPSGVMTDSFGMFSGLRPGDIIRKIDGKRITTVDEAGAAFQRALASPQVVFELERNGQPVTLTMTIEGDDSDDEDDDIDEAALAYALQHHDDAEDDEGGEEGGVAGGVFAPVSLDAIKKINATSYEVPRSLVKAVTDNPTVHAKGARMVLLVTPGKTRGLKVYAIQSNSLFATLGLINGDVLLSVNGLSLSQADKALEVYKQLREAATVKLALQRGGKPMTLEYRVK
ncbi:MAG: PDZ domain-containing protein [Kofleriaceae bacterium]